MIHDAVILGAGIAGVATAIHLRKRGLSVALVDRRAPGEETSHGNAGLIQREGVHPYLFPRNATGILRAALRRGTDADYHLSALPHVAPFLWRYFRGSAPDKARRTLLANIPLFERCLQAHAELMREAGSEHLVARNGWIRVFRDERALPDAERKAAELRDLGLTVGTLDDTGLRALEPHLETSRIEAAFHYHDPWNCSDPGALVKSYAALFAKLGGNIVFAGGGLALSGVATVPGGWKPRIFRLIADQLGDRARPLVAAVARPARHPPADGDQARLSQPTTRREGNACLTRHMLSTTSAAM